MGRLFPSIIILFIFGVVSPAARCAAQNVTNYDSLSDSYLYLFLLREPAIQKDLQLSAEQDTKLTKLNAKIDGPLLALRNWSADNAGKKVSELVSQTQQRCAEILDDNQRRRIKRIMLRVRGVRCVLQPEVADQLMLTSIQRQQIQEALRRGREELGQLRERRLRTVPSASTLTIHLSIGIG